MDKAQRSALWHYVAKERKSKTEQDKPTIRPIVIASQRNVMEDVAFLRRLLVGLANESIVPIVVCPSGTEKYWTPSVPAHLLTHPVLNWPLVNSLGFETLVSQTERHRPTVIHCLCQSRASLACRLAQRLDIPYVQALHMFLDRRRSLTISAQHCTSIVVPAETIRAGVTQLLRPLSRRIKRINVGAFVRSEPICFSDADHLTSLIVAPPVKTLAGYDNLFEAIRILIGQGYEFMTVVIGGGRVEHQLRKMLTDRGLRQVVMVVPPLDPWRSVLVAGDIFIQPQPNRAFSACLLEAMSVGTAVMACKGGVDDLIIHNETALVFDPEDESSTRQTLKRFLDEPEFARRLAGQAQSYLKKHHSVTGMISATLAVYTEAQRQYNHASTAQLKAGASTS